MTGHPGRNERRRRILDAARRMFALHGYDGTSMEAILNEVGGSKATLYAYFPSKEALFDAAMDGAVGGPLAFELDPGSAPRTALTRAAEKIAQVVASPWSTRMQRCVAARAEAAPEAARSFYDQGIGAALRGLETWLRIQHRAGTLQCPDPARSAELFLAMAQGLEAHRAWFGLEPRGEAERGRWIRHAVRSFLNLHQRA